MSDGSGGGGGATATVAVAVRDSGRSRRAARWVAHNLAPRAQRLLLLHVIPPVSAVPSPDGRHVSADDLDPDVVQLFADEQKLSARRVFTPLVKLFGGRKVESLILEGENPADALLRYMQDSNVDNLVMGSSSVAWFNRILRGSDIAMTILRSAPLSCNIYVVSRRKLTVGFSNLSIVDGPGRYRETIKISHKKFTQMQRNSVIYKQISPLGSEVSELSQMSDAKSTASFESAALSSYNGVRLEENLSNVAFKFQKLDISDVMGSIRGTSFALIEPAKEVEDSAEIGKLRLELQNMLAKYNQTCEDFIRAKKQVESLSAECSEESRKVKDALDREKILELLAAEERAKHLEITKDLQEAKELLAKETMDRHSAELIASKMSSEKSMVLDAFFSNNQKCRRYSKKEIEVATDNFSDSKKIGKGSYGDVYKCNLDHVPVAVKVLRSKESDVFYKFDEFVREVEILSQLRHPHMVLLLGVCPENGCLVYEYMENGSLEDLLFNRAGKQPLPWFIRFRIIFEVACGLAFLHNTKPEPIVHRDLKPGNILLDRNFVSKISDVGLAKLMSDLVPDGLTEYKETNIAGTLCYIDPEYHRTGTVRPKSDLFALGIIVLQLLTARHPEGLLTIVENAIKEGSFSKITDNSISDWPLVETERLAKLALKCSRLRCRDRPDLEAEVLPELEQLLSIANVCVELTRCNVYAPSHYVCPILQEIMENPYIAADGYTYEYRGIKAWLEKHNISPVTKTRLQHTSIIPNYSLQSAIQQWKSHAAILPS